MDKRSVLVKNEYQMNSRVAKLMFIAAVICVPIIALLMWMEVFVYHTDSVVALAIIFISFITPHVLTRFDMGSTGWMKYFIIALCTLGVASLYRPFKFDMYFIWTFPVIISCFYFDKKLSSYAFIITLLSFLALDFTIEYDKFISNQMGEGMNSLEQAYALSAITKGLQISFVSFACSALTKMTQNLFQNLISAEEQANLFNRLTKVMQKSTEVSGILGKSVVQLQHMSYETSTSNEQIADTSKKVRDSFYNTINYIGSASEAIKKILGQLREISLKSMNIVEISATANEITLKSGEKIKASVHEMEDIEKTFIESKGIIHKLGDKSTEINKITEIISAISSQTNLLALNAAIEAARAGEQGRGFAVVADEVRKLAEQSQGAARDIKNLVEEVLQFTHNAVSSMENNMSKIEKGRETIHKAGESFEESANVRREVNENVQYIATSSKQIDEYANVISEVVDNINTYSARGLQDVEGIAAAVEQQLSSMQELSAAVNEVDRMSRELQSLSDKNEIKDLKVEKKFVNIG